MQLEWCNYIKICIFFLKWTSMLELVIIPVLRFVKKMALDVILLKDDLVKVLLSVISGCC